ncbi:MAG TPA: hypothetical protein VGN42_00750 [Pirellulales bacterium]|jgi:hypothetical protein|nr:hypothetical protein [Pirellulales bacterium]
MKPRSAETPHDRLAGKRWSAPARALATVLLAWHLVALLVGPLSAPRSILGDALRPLYRPYLEAAYLTHGYKFFGPDPGPSHLIRYDVERADGSHVKGVFPDLKQHWPRLYYHRHFMLSEFVNSLPPDANFDPGLPWERRPLAAAEKVYVRSYADHLLAVHDGRGVSLELVEHLIPEPADVVQGMKLDDARLYRVRPLGEFDKTASP